MEHTIECRSCGETYDPGIYTDACPACRERGESGRLEATYDIEDVRRDRLPFEGGSEEQTIWRYRELLPGIVDAPVSLGEGVTSILRPERLPVDGDVQVWLKNDTTNPTWSFKDRMNALLVSNLVADGVSRIATSSTGNQGASVAAYAARAGVDRTVVLVPHETEKPLLRQIQAYGATVVATEMDGRSDVLGELAERGWYPAVSKLPYGFEGYKTIAYEIFEQLGTAPDSVVFPVGSGDGLYGIWKGFRDLEALGLVSSLPKLIAAQSAERAPMVKAMENDLETLEADPGPMPITVSNATATGSEFTLGAIRESGGYAYASERSEVERAVREIGREGLFVEPTTALTVSTLHKAIDDGHVDAGDTVVCVQTGAGVKWPENTATAVGDVPTIPPSIDALREVVPFDVD